MMNISRTAFFTLVVFDAAAGAVTLRSAFSGDARAAGIDARGRRALKESPVVAQQGDVVSDEDGGERAATNDAIPVIHLTVGGEPVALTVRSKAAVRIEVESTQASADEEDDTPDTSTALPARPISQSNVPTPTSLNEGSVDSESGGQLDHRLLATGDSRPGRIGADTRIRADTSSPTPTHNFIIAQDGSIVLVGSGAELTANTGSSSASGSIALGVSGSALVTGTSTPPGNAAMARPPLMGNAWPRRTNVPDRLAFDAYRLSATDAKSLGGAIPRANEVSRADPISQDGAISQAGAISPADATHLAQHRPEGLRNVGLDTLILGTERKLDPRHLRVIRALQARGFLVPRGGASTGASAPPTTTGSGPPSGSDSLAHANASFLAMFPWRIKPDATGVAISGFEDHSVSAIGNDQILTYDDSNVFIERNGPINANTGDTDSSGLNAVDVRGSRVRSGDSGDAEGGEDEEKSDEESASGTKPPPEETVPEEKARLRPLRRRALQGHARGQAEGAETPDEEPAPNDLPYPDLKKGQSFTTVTDEGGSTAIGKNTFVVGADGFDDVSIRSSGDGNVVTYDDSNLIIGGIGKVNAQIGDSDTGGAVVMGVVDSDLEAGCEGDLCNKKRPPLLAGNDVPAPADTSAQQRPGAQRPATAKGRTAPSDTSAARWPGVKNGRTTPKSGSATRKHRKANGSRRPMVKGATRAPTVSSHPAPAKSRS